MSKPADDIYVTIHFTEDSVPGLRRGKLTAESKTALDAHYLGVAQEQVRKAKDAFYNRPNRFVIDNFTCSEHGVVIPELCCPECEAQEALQQRKGKEIKND